MRSPARPPRAFIPFGNRPGLRGGGGNCLALLLAYLLLALMPVAGYSQISDLPQKPSAPSSVKLDGLNLPFVANAGQTDPKVGFYAQTFAGTVYVTREGELVYSLPPKDGKRGWTLVERFEQGKAQPAGIDANTSRVSYIKDQNGKAVTQNAATFGGVALGEVFPGVRVELRAHGKNVEKIYTLAPGADPARIRMGVAGAKSLTLDKDGNLVAATGNGPVRFSAPVAWQEKEGKRVPVKVSYALDGGRYGYALGEYDRGVPVVIDPLLQATYLGGNGTEKAKAITVDPTTGDVYVAGTTQSAGDGFPNSFPGTSGGYQSGSPYDTRLYSLPFLARFSSDLKTLKQATFVESEGVGDIDEFRIHPLNGDLYIKSYLNTVFSSQVARFSPDLTQLIQYKTLPFQLSSFVIHPINGDLYFVGSKSSQALIVKVVSDLKQYVTKEVGGSKSDEGNGIAVNPKTGDVYITGETFFNDFPGTAGGYQPANNSLPATGIKPDAFVAQFSADLQTLKQATYLGSHAEDAGDALLFSASGDSLYIQGATYSEEQKDFPGLAGGAYPPYPPSAANFIARMSSDLKVLYQSTMVPYLYDLRLLQQIFLHPLTGDIYILGSFEIDGSTKTDGMPSAVRLTPDLTHSYGGLPLIPNNHSDYPQYSGHPGRAYEFSPLTGDIYVVGDQFTAYSIPPRFPATDGGYQPAPSTDTSGLADIFIARFTSDDIITPDTTPDPFSFQEKKGVPLSAEITSNTVTITGISVPTPIKINGGDYSVGCNGKFVNTVGLIENGQTVCVRHTSAHISFMWWDTRLEIGDVAATFTSITGDGGDGGGSGGGNGGGTDSDNGGGSGDSNGGGNGTSGDTPPNPFSFKSKTMVKASKLITSKPVKIKGLKAPAPVNVANGEYSIGCKKKRFTGAVGTIKNKQKVCVRHISAANSGETVTTILNVGGMEGRFSSTTR
jgi:hypothetical protein